MPRPSRPDPTPEDTAKRVLAALRAAGGSITRTGLHETLRPRPHAWLLDLATEILVGDGMVMVGTEVEVRWHILGHEYGVEAIVYRLTPNGLRAARRTAGKGTSNA